MSARYANGRAAIMQDAACDIGAEALTITVSGATITWPYSDLVRTDDNNGAVCLRLKTDTGERVVLDQDGAISLRRAAPKLFTPAARGIEGVRTVGAIAASAWALALVFLVGVPMAAEPIAGAMPPMCVTRSATSPGRRLKV